MHHSQFADLVLLLGFNMFPEDVVQQRALVPVFCKLLWHLRASFRPAVSGKRQGMSCAAERQQGQRPHRRIPGVGGGRREYK